MFDKVNGDQVRLSPNKYQSPPVWRVAAASPHVIPGTQSNSQQSSFTLNSWYCGGNNNKQTSRGVVPNRMKTQIQACSKVQFLPRATKPYTSTQILGVFKLPISTGQSPYGASGKYILNQLALGHYVLLITWIQLLTWKFHSHRCSVCLAVSTHCISHWRGRRRERKHPFNKKSHQSWHIELAHLLSF